MSPPRARPYYAIVEDWLAANIASGALQPGTRLTVAAVADRLSVSRSPAKRALDLLARGPLVAREDGQGYVVAPAGVPAVPVNLFALPLSAPQGAVAADRLVRPGWETILTTVAAEIAAAIPFGVWAISESGIGSHFGVSRTVTREVLARLSERGAITKDRALHWVAGPLSARMLDEEHGLRRLLEPAALQAAAPRLAPALLAGMRARLDRAAMDEVETDLHQTCLAPQPNRRLEAAIRAVQAARSVNRLFATLVRQHDESAHLAEHRLVLDHLALGDAAGAARALAHHLDGDHDRTRARLKVLSVFAEPPVAPWLARLA